MTDNTIDVDAVLAAMIERKRVNSIDIMDAVFVRDGKVLKASYKARDSHRFTGLCTGDFVASTEF